MENTIELMERLGRPERDLKVIHVAGTNGKRICMRVSFYDAGMGEKKDGAVYVAASGENQ